MSDIKTTIMDSAERRMQRGGFGGFSFREIAADVGIKSSSVHYHFPTKDDLAAAVITRWTDRTAAHMDVAFAADPNPARVWREAFRGTARSDAHMCPCTVLGAGSQDLPDQVATAVRRFFQMCDDKMTAQGLSRAAASHLRSTLTGALVVANALGDMAEYDRATETLIKPRITAPA